MSVCEIKNYTHLSDNCILSIVCGDSVVKEFQLDELHVIDTPQGFVISDGKYTMTFDASNHLDITANQVRALRNECTQSDGGNPDPDTGCCYYEVTRAELEDLVSDGVLVKGAMYRITDRGDNGIYITAISNKELTPNGTRSMLIPNPLYFTPETIYSYIKNKTSQYSTGSVVCYDGLVYICDSDNPSHVFSPAENNEWIVVPKELPIPEVSVYLGGEGNENIAAYVVHEFGIVYDYINDWIGKQWDEHGNEVGMSYVKALGMMRTARNPVDTTDWFTAQNYLYGHSWFYMFNNKAMEIANNRSESGEWSFVVADNNITHGPISENYAATIRGNTIREDLNVIHGDGVIKGISYNGLYVEEDTADVVYVYIENNDNGGISNNSGVYYITDNVNNGYINGIVGIFPMGILVSNNDNNGNIGPGSYPLNIVGTTNNL